MTLSVAGVEERLSYGPFQLGSLKKGEVREVPQKVLKEQLGDKFRL